MFKVVESEDGAIGIDFDTSVMEKPMNKLTAAEQGALEAINCLQAWFNGTLAHLGYLEKLLTVHGELDTIGVLKDVMSKGLPEDVEETDNEDNITEWTPKVR
jgi:hypothetical protein